MQHIGASGIRDFFDRGRRIPDSIDLSIGQAHYDVPDAIKEATISAIRETSGRYSATQGFPEIVEATQRYLRAAHGLPEDEEVMLTVGASGALAASLLALVDPGDEVLLPDPHFVVYRNLVHLADGIPTYYDLYPDYQLRVDRVARAITDRTRILILNSPANPTGATHTADELSEVAELCRQRGIFVLSDELYAHFCYDEPHTSIKRFLGPESLLIGGFSKTYGMAGWRLGWAAGTSELIDRMRTLQQFVYTCPPTLVQMGAVAAFDVDTKPYVDLYRNKRDLICDGLAEAGYEFVRPTGSFFVFPKVPWGDDRAFCERALEERLIVVPGRTFSRQSTHFRISYAADDEQLKRGLEVLARIVDDPKG